MMGRRGEAAWAWYYTQNEDRWNGGLSCREEAIEAGLLEFNGEPFMIARARKGELDFCIPGWRIIEILEELNEEVMDPDGDSLFGRLSPGQEAHLSYLVGEAVSGWARYWGVLPSPWRFDDKMEVERILSTAAYDESRRRFYHLKIAQMGFHSTLQWDWQRLFAIYPETRHIANRDFMIVGVATTETKTNGEG
jgi:hypothetical protein